MYSQLRIIQLVRDAQYGVGGNITATDPRFANSRLMAKWGTNQNQDKNAGVNVAIPINPKQTYPGWRLDTSWEPIPWYAQTVGTGVSISFNNPPGNAPFSTPDDDGKQFIDVFVGIPKGKKASDAQYLGALSWGFFYDAKTQQFTISPKNLTLTAAVPDELPIALNRYNAYVAAIMKMPVPYVNTIPALGGVAGIAGPFPTDPW